MDDEQASEDDLGGGQRCRPWSAVQYGDEANWRDQLHNNPGLDSIHSEDTVIGWSKSSEGGVNEKLKRTSDGRYEKEPFSCR